MNVNLGPVFDDFVADLLKTGLYQSQSEILREGLRLLKEREESKGPRLSELRKEYRSRRQRSRPWQVRGRGQDVCPYPAQKQEAKDFGEMKAFVLTPLAARDLNEIWDYLANDSIEAATECWTPWRKRCTGWRRIQAQGHWREDLADRRHRFFLVYSYLIVYRPETKPVQVIRVLHASRDIQTLLDFPSETP